MSFIRSLDVLIQNIKFIEKTFTFYYDLLQDLLISESRILKKCEGGDSQGRLIKCSSVAFYLKSGAEIAKMMPTDITVGIRHHMPFLTPSRLVEEIKPILKLSFTLSFISKFGKVTLITVPTAFIISYAVMFLPLLNPDVISVLDLTSIISASIISVLAIRSAYRHIKDAREFTRILSYFAHILGDLKAGELGSLDVNIIKEDIVFLIA